MQALGRGRSAGEDQPGKISRHPWRKRFEAAYGAEAELLQADAYFQADKYPEAIAAYD